MSARRSLKGRLLVAAPNLVDPSFHRSVVFMLEDSDDGALGVILNRPTTLRIHEALPPELHTPFPEDGPIFEGGPVDPDSVIVVGEYHEVFAPAEGDVALGTVRVIEPDSDFETLADRVSDLRVFGGYAGWSAGQLDDEVSEGAWIECECHPSDIFSPTPRELWHDVLDRQGGTLRLVARMPEDPSLN